MALELSVASAVAAWTGASVADATTIAGAVEARIGNYCNRMTEDGADIWNRIARVEYLDGELSEGVLLKWTPISAVSSVQIVGGYTNSAEVLTDVDLTSLACDGIAIADLSGNFGRVGMLHYRNSAGRMWESDFYSNRTARVPTANFGSGRQRIKVSYTGGFPSGIGGMPADLKLAVLVLSKNIYDAKSVSSTLQSESLGNYSYTNSTGKESGASELLMGNVKDLLQAYRSYANIV